MPITTITTQLLIPSSSSHIDCFARSRDSLEYMINREQMCVTRQLKSSVYPIVIEGGIWSCQCCGVTFVDAEQRHHQLSLGNNMNEYRFDELDELSTLFTPIS